MYDFAARHDRLRTRMREVNGREVTYRRGEDEIETTATVYELGPDELIAFGLPRDQRRRDYIIDTDDLAELGQPQQGDQIDDGTLTCTVVPMGDEPCFRFTNHQRKAVRVHTEL